MELIQHDNGVWHAHGVVMGGPWQIRFIMLDAADMPEIIAEAAYQALLQVDMQMSHYKETSNLMQLNRAPVGKWIDVPLEMAKVMDMAATLADFTDDAIDITLGQAINQWGFGPQSCPDTMGFEYESGYGHAAYEVRLSPPAVFKHQNVQFNLASLAKGFAVDQAADAVITLGIKDFLIEAAGEVYAQGKRSDGTPWIIGLELPVPGECLVYDDLPLNGISVATSGTYRKYHEVGEKYITHTLDPKTGAPVESDLLSVTVLDPCCMRADALATALFIQGIEDGSSFAKMHHIPVQFMFRQPEGIAELRSQAWMDYLEKSACTAGLR